MSEPATARSNPGRMWTIIGLGSGVLLLFVTFTAAFFAGRASRPDYPTVVTGKPALPDSDAQSDAIGDAQSTATADQASTEPTNSAPTLVNQSASPTSPAPVAETPLTAEDIFARAAPAVAILVVKSKDGADLGLGSGFFIDKEGTLITSAHVALAQGAGFALVRLTDKTTYFIEQVKAVDKANDLAVLQVTGRDFPCLRLADAAPKVGSRVFAVGNPVGLTHTISEGIVSGLRPDEQHPALIQNTAPMGPGSSGGPLMNDRGEVIGVIRGGVKEGQNLNLAVSASLVQDVAKRDEKPQTIRAVTFFDKFSVDNAAWLYGPDGKTLTPKGQDFVGAMIKLRGKGVSDPEQLAREALKSVGIEASISGKTRTTKAAKSNADSLWAIKNVRVIVEAFDGDTRAAGLRGADLQTLVELRLRKSNFKLLSLEETKTTPRAPHLIIRVHATGTKDPLAYAVELALRQTASIGVPQSDGFVELRTMAETWQSTTRCGTASRAQLAQAVKDALDGALSDFENAHLAANPER